MSNQIQPMSKYNSPMITWATMKLNDLKKNPKYNTNNKKAKIEFTNKWNQYMGLIRAEENRIAYDNNDWMDLREREFNKI